MLNSVKELAGFSVFAPDEDEIGTVREVYFDDARWAIRHLVVDTGGWFSDRRVLVSPHAARGLDRARRRLMVALTRQQVQQAPSADTDRPVSRQYEAAAYDYYGYPYYWGGDELWGMLEVPLGGATAPFVSPAAEPGVRLAPERAQVQAERGDPHLRSSREVIGYDVAARDGDIGHVHDFLFDARSWQILLLVVDTHNWLPDRLVLVPPGSVDKVDRPSLHVGVAVSRLAVEASPPYEPQRGIDAEQARRIRQRLEGIA
jgi:uncharacterized protein YrrD